MPSISSSLTSSRTAGGGGELLARSSSAGVNDQRLILVVEDDDATRSFLLDNLAADGFRVAGASSPQEGVRAIEVRQPSLVVLDLAFENGSGLDLLDRLRAADGLASRLDPDLPVVVLTGRAGEADRVRSFARGADDHLSKPTCRFPQHAIPVRFPGNSRHFVAPTCAHRRLLRPLARILSPLLGRVVSTAGTIGVTLWGRRISCRTRR